MILIIPDIHGRNFWKNAVEKHFEDTSKTIFLGDYLDPYPWEGITRKEAIANFQEIIDFKKENKDKVGRIYFLGFHQMISHILTRKFFLQGHVMTQVMHITSRKCFALTEVYSNLQTKHL